jgi:hypothetical protein
MPNEQSPNENFLKIFALDDDDDQISPSSNQEQSNNNKSDYSEESENDELLETHSTNVLSNPILIDSSSTIECVPELTTESVTMMSNTFEPVLSQSAPAETSIAITTGSSSVPINESDNSAYNYELTDHFSVTSSFEK